MQKSTRKVETPHKSKDKSRKIYDKNQWSSSKNEEEYIKTQAYVRHFDCLLCFQNFPKVLGLEEGCVLGHVPIKSSKIKMGGK